MAEQIITDIAIIGAGYAGIAAAERVSAAGKSVAILEARDRIGGRTLTQTLSGGATVDLGAQWIGPDQHLVWDWVRKSGAETYECFDEGKNILSWRGKHSTYTGTIPRIDPLSLIDLGLALHKINKLSREVSLESPWTHPKAELYDSMTVATWMRRQMRTAKARHLFSIGIETIFAAEPGELSMLGALFYCRSGKDMDTLIGVTGGAQQTLLTHGTQGLLERIATPLKENIYLSSPVRRITQETDRVIVECDGLRVTARKAILAIPPALTDRISFDPILPQMKAQLIQRMPMGAAMKCFCIYERPFWRTAGFSGQVVGDRPPVKVAFDCSKGPDSHGILLVFVEANDARAFIQLPDAERKRQIIEGLVPLFGEQARHPVEYIDKCWTEEEWSRGCYVGNSPPGVITAFKDTLRTPFLNLHFAGTETATEWNGYLDGAIQSGYRAAGEVLQKL